MSTAVPAVGTVGRIITPDGIERRGRVLQVSSDGEDVLIRWIDYPHLSPDWIPLRTIPGQL